MKIILRLTILLLMFNALQLSAQDKEKVPFKDRLVFGGDLVLNFGNNFSAFGGAPMIGYRVSDRYMAGVTLRYVHISQNSSKTNNYGGSVFNRFTVTDELFLHGEIEYLEFEQKFNDGFEPSRIKGSFPAVLVGAGYRQSIGGGSYIGFTVLYDILQDPNSFYNGPILRGGVVFGR